MTTTDTEPKTDEATLPFGENVRGVVGEEILYSSDDSTTYDDSFFLQFKKNVSLICVRWKKHMNHQKTAIKTWMTHMKL